MKSRMIYYIFLIITTVSANKEIDLCEVCECKQNFAVIRCTGSGQTSLPIGYTSAPMSKTITYKRYNIQKISAENFKGLTKSSVENLILARNNIRDIEQLAFSSIGKTLKTLSLGRNKLTDINKGVFNGLDKLEKLDLRENDLRLVKGEVYADLFNLGTLLLENNQIIGIDAFPPLLNLTYLDLDINELKTINNNNFKYLQGLTTLSLRRNKISKIANDAFISNFELTTLGLKDNFLNCALPTLQNFFKWIRSTHINVDVTCSGHNLVSQK